MTPSIPIQVSLSAPAEDHPGTTFRPGDITGESSAAAKGTSTGLLARLGAVLFGPSRALTSAVDRRQARLLAVFGLISAALTTVGTVMTVTHAQALLNRTAAVYLGSTTGLFLCAYALSRTRHVRYATGALIGTSWVLTAATPVLNFPGPLFVASAWFCPAILVAGVLASARTTLLVGVASVGYTLILGSLGFGEGPGDVGHAVLFLTDISALTCALSHHRTKVEQDRSAQLRARNAELLALKSTLEQRVELRTADLKKSHDDLDCAYQELRKNQQALLISEKMASLGRLTAGIAHEMNSPLAAVRASISELRGLLEEYERSIDDPDVTDEDHHAIAKDMDRAAQLADRAAERAAAFVRSIKSQTRDIGARDRARFDAAAVVRDALQMLGHEVTASRCRVHLQCAEEPLELDGAPGKLAQIVTNLVTNALDASAERGGGDVHVDLARHGGAVTLTVRDRGPGIPDDVLEKIFDPLFTTKPMGKGTGLGLTIVHDIVCGDFRGKVDVKTAPGQGAAFIVHLPARART